MLFKQYHKDIGKTLYTSKPLLITAQDGYVRPKPNGKEWFQTSTTIWRVDELIRRRVRDWKRLLGETGHTGARAQAMRKDHDSLYTATHSVFPAPLMEYIILRYAGEPGGKILDAFAGGPPRAVVSSIMGMQYTGIEIRQEQIDDNLKIIKPLGLKNIRYELGDARYMDGVDNDFDCAITCPPYYDLEIYSDHPQDISGFGTYAEFNAAMWLCANAHLEHMKPGAFVCIVVGPFRNKKTGELIDFKAHTVENFRDAGFYFHQEILLTKNFASAAVRAGTAWKGKKLIPAHEYLLVFRTPK